MRKVSIFFLLACLLVFSTITVFAENNLGREILGDQNGWAAYGDGTTGGANAKKENVYTVTNRSELTKALGGKNNNTPKIIYVKGEIKVNQPYEKYKDPEYNFQDYLKKYSPENWGMEKEVSGALDEARARSAENQQEDVIVYVGSNTSIIGLGDNAKIVGVNLRVVDAKNVIIRNIDFESPVDYFPQWDPTDGDNGHWNSELDCITIDGSKNVWLDHNSFSDGDFLDPDGEKYFGMQYQRHDGLIDIINQSDLITVSYNYIHDHAKTILVGADEDATQNRGHLRVTFHHNFFEDLVSRNPRVRFGKVHVYNNYYKVPENADYSYRYSLGVGVECKTYAENNYFDLNWENVTWNGDITTIIQNWAGKGQNIYTEGSILKLGSSKPTQIDLVDQHNTIHPEKKVGRDVGWKPTLYKRLDPTENVPAIVIENAGAGNL